MERVQTKPRYNFLSRMCIFTAKDSTAEFWRKKLQRDLQSDPNIHDLVGIPSMITNVVQSLFERVV